MLPAERAALMDASSEKEPVCRLTPKDDSACAAELLGERTRACTVALEARRERAVAPPCWPVAPVTRTRGIDIDVGD